MKRSSLRASCLLFALVVLAMTPLASKATQLVLKDGRIIQGKKVPLTGVAAKPDLGPQPGPGALVVFMLDDDLRRTFVSRWMIVEERPDGAEEALERFRLKQPVATVGGAVRSVGPIFDISPFDKFGRRSLKMLSARGKTTEKIGVVQAITELTPRYSRVESTNFVWDMRLATSSIPPDELAAILENAANPKDIEQRKRVARFYMQAQRYEDATKELEKILADFPNKEEVQQQLAPSVARIKQLSAMRLLEELKFRADAGQHRMVRTLLEKFPTDGPSGETIQAVLEMKRQYDVQELARTKLLQQFDDLAAKISDAFLQKRLRQVREELGAEMTYNTLIRMAAFREMADDTTLKPEEKLALAISGWMVGRNAATAKLSTALSMVEVRLLIERYFAAEDKIARARVLAEFGSQEANTPEMVAQILAHMRPPVQTERTSPDASQPFELKVNTLTSTPPVRYLVQLPPEYDPYRRYPAIVSLHGASTTPEMQVEWWAGGVTPGGFRNGQATRHGYIVIAPAWTEEHQNRYQYSAREHAAVLHALRDACRRFSIDADRVFLTGHSMGADAAWDIGLAHPDLWAGVIPIGGKGDKYVTHYWANSKNVPFYFVCGELDAARGVAANAREWDRALQSPGYNITIVEFQGRGHEHFSDEILRMFDWMSRLKRNPFPREFNVVSMRPWDNYFWWVELADFPESGLIDPEQFNSRKPRPLPTEASISKGDSIFVQSAASQVTVWLSPEMVELGRRLNIQLRGRRMVVSPTPQVETILEDARTRGDRQHPFWAKVETPTGR